MKDDKIKYVCVWIMIINKENTIKSGDNFVLIIYYYQSLTIVLNNNVVTQLCGWNVIRKPDVVY